MKLTLSRLSALVAAAACSSPVVAAEIDARPADRLTLTGNGSRFDSDDEGAGGSLNWLHYVTPDAIFGLGAEHQYIEESKWSFGSARASWGRGERASRFSLFGEVNYGDGDDNGRSFDYGVAVLGISQSFTSQLSLQLESKQIEIDRTHGNLPKLGLTYLWTPTLSTNVAYAQSIGGNLGTELYSARIDHYGPHFNLLVGGAFGRADPIVVNLQPGSTVPVQDTQQWFFGIGKTFARGEVLLLGDYLGLEINDKVTVTLSFTAYLGSRGRPR